MSIVLPTIWTKVLTSLRTLYTQGGVQSWLTVGHLLWRQLQCRSRKAWFQAILFFYFKLSSNETVKAYLTKEVAVFQWKVKLILWAIKNMPWAISHLLPLQSTLKLYSVSAGMEMHLWGTDQYQPVLCILLTLHSNKSSVWKFWGTFSRKYIYSLGIYLPRVNRNKRVCVMYIQHEAYNSLSKYR